MKHLARLAVLAAMGTLSMGMLATEASAGSGTKASGYVVSGSEVLSFHASGSTTKASGGFEFYSSEVAGGYISGDVVCYNGTGSTAEFVGVVRKPKDQGGRFVTFYVQDVSPDGTGDAFAYSGGVASCDNRLSGELRYRTSGDIVIK